MKHLSELKPQRTYHARASSLEYSMRKQDEAEIIALRQGDEQEAKRRRDARQDLQAKRKRSEVKPIAFGIIRELGPRDPIGYMLKARELEERHGRTALMLRTYEMPAPKSPKLERVEGSGSTGLENIVHVRLVLSRAKEAAELTLPSAEYKKPVSGLVCGSISLTQAGRLVNGNAKRGQDQVKEALRKYLEAAEPFFGRIT